MNRRLLMLAGLVSVAGTGSFLLGRGVIGSQGPKTCPSAATSESHACCDHPALCNWLQLSDDQRQRVRAADPAFSAEAGRLRSDIQKAKETLATVLEDSASTDEEVVRQVERLIDASNSLERRIAQHLLAIRPLLTAEQSKQLMGVVAGHVRDEHNFVLPKHELARQPACACEEGDR